MPKKLCINIPDDQWQKYHEWKDKNKDKNFSELVRQKINEILMAEPEPIIYTWTGWDEDDKR